MIIVIAFCRPTVTEKDMTNVELEKLLAVPEKVVKVTLEEVLSRDKMEVSPDNSCNDDTLSGDEAQKIARKLKSVKSVKNCDNTSKSTKKYRGYKPTVPLPIVKSVTTAQKVAQQESRWKQKAEVEKKERLAKKIEAQRRAKQDVVVPEEIATERKKRT
ncbi:unnamed protein product [Caenorhabditis angaria]|uniref:Uncharacterized protein n=1 Tax=Caenorhabditis angaria TaxID=860376 RepID=A0A9P1I7T4_9PELO|nr:unnamed protein product [Caenorhabditis angaria]